MAHVRQSRLSDSGRGFHQRWRMPESVHMYTISSLETTPRISGPWFVSALQSKIAGSVLACSEIALPQAQTSHHQPWCTRMAWLHVCPGRVPPGPDPHAHARVNPKPETRNPKPKTQNPKPQTRSPKPEAQNLQPQTPNPKPQIPNPKPQSPKSKSQALNPKFQIPNPKFQIPNPKPQSLNIKPGLRVGGAWGG